MHPLEVLDGPAVMTVKLGDTETEMVGLPDPLRLGE